MKPSDGKIILTRHHNDDAILDTSAIKFIAYLNNVALPLTRSLITIHSNCYCSFLTYFVMPLLQKNKTA